MATLFANFGKTLLIFIGEQATNKNGSTMSFINIKPVVL
ncbi:MAG: hypothetical protein ACI9YP_000782 [Colwellia sp.]|jgi:hypothetical protein